MLGCLCPGLLLADGWGHMVPHSLLRLAPDLQGPWVAKGRHRGEEGHLPFGSLEHSAGSHHRLPRPHSGTPTERAKYCLVKISERICTR